MNQSESMRLGVVLERRSIENRWVDHVWQPVSVVPGAPEVAEFRLLQGGKGWAQYLAASLMLELFRTETEGYRYNLSQSPPVIYVVLRNEGRTFEDAPRPFRITACPYEARDYSESGGEIVEPVPMPDAVAAWIQDYVARHHVDRPFVKRKRGGKSPVDGGSSYG